MRVADRPLPAITLDADALADWPVRPVIAIEQRAGVPYVWDGGQTWDTAGQVWDAPPTASQWVDATCDFTGLEIAFDEPDESLNFPAGRCTIQLDNRSGRWARYNVDGSPADFGAGTQVWIWATDRAAGAWWMFAGRVSRWDELTGDVIEVEAFDYLSDLAQPIGTITPGADGDLPAVRLAAVMALANAATLRSRFANGVVHLTRQATDAAPLEEMETVAASDGGVLYGDADGTVVYADRFWRAGRIDQSAIPIVSTNVCSAPLVLWDPVLSTSDTALASTVTLENIAGMKATASKGPPSSYVVARQDLQWSAQAEGDALATWLVSQLWQPRVALDTADIYIHTGIWAAVDWRRGDRIRLLHDSRTPGGVARIDIAAVLISLAHGITPDGWVLTIGTTRALDYYTPTTWDSGAVWDGAGQVWGY